MTCAVCGQVVTPAACAPVERDRHRWCSAHHGRYLPTGAIGLTWIEPVPDLVSDDLPSAVIEAQFLEAARAIRLRRRAS